MININNSINFFTKNLSKIVIIITIILVIFVAYLGAKLTWLVLTPSASTASWKAPSSQEQKTENSSVNFSNFHWFGKANEQQKQPVKQTDIIDAPKTTLKMTLTGLVAHNDTSRSMAIIDYQSNQETYFIDQKVKTTRVSIAEIHSDRVILNNKGKYETLMLDGFDYTKIHKNTNKPVSSNKKITSKKLTKELAKTRSEILKDPGKIIDYISITPVNRGGSIKGYRLNPGKRPELFSHSGLQPRDLAVAINGYDLTDTSQSLRVMSELANMTNILITVERDGQLTDIEFSLP